MDLVRFPIGDPDVDDLCIEDLLDPVAYELIHRLHVEVLGESALHVVDQRELGVALPGLLEQPGVLERHGEAAGEGREQSDVGVAERVLSVDVLQGDHAGRATATTRGTNTDDTAGSPAITGG